MKGSEHNDLYNSDGTTKESSGGIQGGISNGMDIYSSCFKPVATIMQKTRIFR
jgi:chorismate synthase